MIPTSAAIYSLLTLVVVLFQFALALGAPWGHLAMGGRFPGKFPPQMRIAAIVQACVLTVLAVVVLTRSGIVLPEFYEQSYWAIWGVVAIATLSLVMNLMTPSRWERILWAPVAGVLLLCSLMVALA